MDKKTYRLPLQFFADETESASEVDYGAVFGVESKEINEDNTENSGESVLQEHSTEQEGENSEPATQTNVEDEIPNEVWKKARLKAEREADIKIKQMQEQLQNNLADDEYLGGTNPFTGKIIKTKLDQQEFLEAQSREALKQSGLNENLIQEMINNNPVIKEAQALKEQIQQERGKNQIDEQIKIISDLNSEIKTFEDLTKLPNRDKIDDLVINKGYTLVDAYKVVNYDELVEKKMAVAKQQAINAVKGKAHLVSTDGTGSDDVVIPSDVMEQYKLFLPNATLSEIKKHYAKTHK